MLEIIAIWQLTKNIGQIVEKKGHSSGVYKFLTVVLWFGGEIVGGAIGIWIIDGNESAQCIVYFIALLGAVIGGGISYLIANNLPDIAPHLEPRGPLNTYQLLTKLKDKLDAGQISQQEYDIEKEDILSRM